uniref:G_PROTEIN_RECEP_F1_2 domain-containing protein n=1 Tax=Panagrellus redivivus TaxID=6233 RepID=A0A7E4UU77_PANRE
MNKLLFNHQAYELEYNCSFYNVNQIPLEDRRHPIVGCIFILTATLMILLYIPCLVVFCQRRFRKQACYKLMVFLGVIDVVLTFCNGVLTGFFVFFGIVYCDIPLIIYIIGSFGQGLWCAQSVGLVFLALNRCLEMARSHLSELLFDKKLVYVWMGIAMVYCLIVSWYSTAFIFSGFHMTWQFNPHAGYFEDVEHKYRSAIHMPNNLFVIVAMVLIYTIFAVIFWKKTSGTTNRKHVAFFKMMTSSSFKVSKNILFLGDSFAKAVTLDALATLCKFDEWDTAIDDNMLRLSPPQNTNQLKCLNDEDDNGQHRPPEIRLHSFVKKDDTVFNFIDVPECGAITGAAFNKHNSHFLNDLTEIHAIVVVVNGKGTHFLDEFIRTLNNVLTWLPKAAAANLIFVGCDVANPHLSVPPLQKYLDVVNADYESKFDETLNLTALNRLYFVDYTPFDYLTTCRKAVYMNDNEPEPRLIDLRGRWETTRYTLFALLNKVMTLQSISTAVIRDVDAARTMLKIGDKVISEFDFYKHKQAISDVFQEQQSFVGSVYDNIEKEIHKIKNTVADAELFLRENSIFPVANVKLTSLQYEMVFDKLYDTSADVQKLQINNNNLKNRSINGKALTTYRQWNSFGQDLIQLFQLKYTGSHVESAFNDHYRKINIEVENPSVTVADSLPLW